MNLNQIESKIRNLVTFQNPFEFIFEFLAAYNIPKATVTRLKKGNSNLSKQQGEVILKKKLFFKEELMMDLHESISILEKSHKHNERFLIVTDWKTFLAIDTKTNDKLDTDFKELPKHYDFFLPWAGMEKTQHANENPADVKAAEKMAKLFDAIKQNNPDDSKEFVHSLNVFLSRLLFCFFAEDTNIFEENQFTNAISSHTQADGSDLSDYLDKLFDVLNTPPGKRENLPSYLEAFPYVNGGLFKVKLKAPRFNRKARQSIIDSGELNWSDINPDIFGSMFQAVIDVDQRGSLGQHYTSVTNIMKVIEPLFLNELREEFEKAHGNKKKLVKLLERLKNIKIFDPACGSGNFLIIAYKELRRLEIKVLEELKQIQGDSGTVSMDFGADYLSHISLNNFHGIELDDFAHEIAKLALWLAEHQMNQEFFKTIGKSNPTLPLKGAGQIVHGNAAVLNWKEVCPKSKEDEIYLIGNPPYVGSRMQNASQKEELANVCKGFKKYKTLDYVSIWFVKGANYIKSTQHKLAFVSTNSICQGEQVAMLWSNFLKNSIKIEFAYQPFNWSNSAKSKAGVTVIIIGLTATATKTKKIFSGNQVQFADNINPYLRNAPTRYLQNRTKPISGLPPISAGNYTGHALTLSMSREERDSLLHNYPESELLIKKLLGSREFLHGEERYCLWIKDAQLELANSIPPIKERIEQVKIARENSKDKSANRIANRPHQYRDTKETKTTSVIIPTVSSEKRDYIPLGFIDSNIIVSNRNHIIYDVEPYVFSILSSRMHNLWVKVVAGRMRMDINYSSDMCYNNYPFPIISEGKKDELMKYVLRILDARQNNIELTLAQMYNSNSMPDDLREAHELNDIFVERCYRANGFSSDEERIEFMFNLYERLIRDEMNAATLFAKQKKSRKKK